MKIGISTFVNDDSIDRVSLARAIEERGFGSLVVAEHTHIPASRVGASSVAAAGSANRNTTTSRKATIILIAPNYGQVKHPRCYYNLVYSPTVAAADS